MLSKEQQYLSRLFKVKRTECRMMDLRGYDISKVYVYSHGDQWFKDEDLNIFMPPHTFEEFYQKHVVERGLFKERKQFTSIYTKKDDENDRVCVVYTDPNKGKKVSTAGFAFAMTLISSFSFNHIIIVTENGLDPKRITLVKKDVKGQWIEVFSDKELVILPFEHVYSPIHIKYIPEEKTEEWAKEEGLVLKDLPLIKTTDAMAKIFGARIKDGIQSTVINADGELGVFYRRVRD